MEIFFTPGPPCLLCRQLQLGELVSITAIRSNGVIIKATFHVNFGRRTPTGDIWVSTDNFPVAYVKSTWMTTVLVNIQYSTLLHVKWQYCMSIYDACFEDVTEQVVSCPVSSARGSCNKKHVVQNHSLQHDGNSRTNLGKTWQKLWTFISKLKRICFNSWSERFWTYSWKRLVLWLWKIAFLQIPYWSSVIWGFKNRTISFCYF